MKDQPSLDFGLLIAFVAPGAVGLWALSHFSTDLQTAFDSAASADAGIGLFLFVLLGALAAGVFISGVRWVVVDVVLFKFLHHLLNWGTLSRLSRAPMLSRPKLDQSKLGDENIARASAGLVKDYYRFFQFYSNMAVALPLAYLAWHHGQDPTLEMAGGWLYGSIAAEGMLLVSAASCLNNYFKGLTGVFKGAEVSE